MRESAIFYRSFYEAIKDLPSENQAEIYTAIFEYALNFKELELKGISKTIFTLVKPQIQANNRKYKVGKLGAEYGKLGGRGKKRKDKETPTKPQELLTETPNVNATEYDNDKENNNVNKKENEKENVNAVNKPSLSSFSFNQFWNLYNKKTGLTMCQAIWEELSEADKELIKERLPAYIKATEREITFRKDPYTWLDGKHWLDEHVPFAKPLSAFERLAATGSYD